MTSEYCDDEKTSATDELRRMLDERRVHWWEGEDERKTLWESSGLTWEYFNDENGDAWLGFLGACEQDITPEQAIAATLGGGECELHGCEGSFSAVNRPVWRCDCGAFMTQYTDATTYHKPRYCPNCGRKAAKR